MKYREAMILARQNYSADKTEPIKIDLTQPISAITITYEPDNNPSGTHATAHPVRCISQITLDNGSDVLFSASGASAQGVDYYDRNKVTPSIMCYLNGMYSEMVINMNFGNFLFDPEYVLLPELFKNLFLNITMDIDGGGDEANDGYLTVVGHIFDEMPVNPVGFVMTKEEKEYTLVDSSTERTYLPTDYPYKQLFARAQRYGTGPEYQIDEVTLDVNNGQSKPIDLTMFQVLRNIAQQYSPYEEWILCHSSTTVQYFYNTPCYWPNFAYVPWRNSSVALAGVCYGGDGGRFEYDAGSSGPNASIFCRGWAPHAVVPIIPRRGDGGFDSFDFTGVKNLRLDLKGTSSVGTSQLCQVITQQYRMY